MARMKAVMAAVLVMEKEGVTQAFGVPGAAINPLYAALKERGSIGHVLARHVEGASHMAEGYTRAVAGPRSSTVCSTESPRWFVSALAMLKCIFIMTRRTARGSLRRFASTANASPRIMDFCGSSRAAPSSASFMETGRWITRGQMASGVA